MLLTDNERLQEIFLVIGDKLAPVGKKWWYALAITMVAMIPAYYLIKYGFVQLAVNNYKPPQIIYTAAIKQPLQVLDKQIFTFPNNSYAGYVKLKNINLEWGVPSQDYTVEFQTLGGTTITKVSGSTFILPASEKLIVFSRFSATQKPDQILFRLATSHFIHKPDVSFNYQLERTSIQNTSDGLVVSAGIKNQTAFTVNQINLPVAVYNSQNQIVAVNFTYINDMLSGETRTFQYAWPSSVPGATRAEIAPELNVFDRNVFQTQAGVSPFTNQ